MINFPGPDKILLLMVIALVVLGPTRLPSAARTAGRWVAELRKLTSRFQDEMHGALADPSDALTSAVGDLRREVGAFREGVGNFGRSVIATTDQPPPAADPTPATLSRSGLPPLPPVPDDPSLN